MWELWEWGSTWSCNWAMFSMTASRLGQVELALTALLMEVNITTAPGKSFGPVRRPGVRDIMCYLPAGHNHPNTTGQLSGYMPGNGAVLLAVGAMAGRRGGFPEAWRVRTEGFHGYLEEEEEEEEEPVTGWAEL